MMAVRFDEDTGSGSLSLTVHGHAGFSESGKDIVCAAASILAYTVAQVVTDMKTDLYLKKTPAIQLCKGDAVIVCHPKEKYINEVRQTFLVAQTGYELLAHHYPQYVELKKFGKAKA